jgi:uncharacterized membrane protein
MLKLLLIVLLFALIASPMLFKTVAGFLGSWVASNTGSTTPAGLLLHGVVFILASRVVMQLAGYRQYRSYRMYAEPETYAEDASGYAEPETYAEEAEKYAEEAEKYAEEMYAEEPYEEYAEDFRT